MRKIVKMKSDLTPAPSRTGRGMRLAARCSAVVLLLGLMAGMAEAGAESKPKALSFTSTGVTFANLGITPPQVNGTITLCTDCQQTSVCLGAGGGAVATRIAGVWQCGNPTLAAVNDVAPVPVAISTATTLVLPAYGHSLQVLTFSASAPATIPQGNWAGQGLILDVCQNGTGGFTPTLSPISGLTLVGTMPTFTQTANKCGDVFIEYFSKTTAYIQGGTGGPL